MPLTYTITVVDSPEYKAMICGRTEDLAEVLDYLVQKKSMALFGEWRIGKTSLLYLLRDILNGEIRSYQQKCIDQDFVNRLADLQAKVPQYRALYISLQSLKESSELTESLKLKAQDIGLLSSISPVPQNYNLSEVFAILAKACGTTHQLVILIDEMEVLQYFDDREQVLRMLRSALQSHSCIHFVFVGAENWYDDYQDKSSRLYSVVEKKILQAPDRSSIEQYLIAQPLTDYLPPTYDIREITSLVLEWTGCKPFYVQDVCATIIRLYQKHRGLPNDWKTRVQEELYEQRNKTIGDFYKGRKVDELSQKILSSLAKYPRLTAPQIARRLASPKKDVTVRIKDLLAFDKIRERNGKYHIVGTLIEEWGKKNLDIPSAHNVWVKYIRWTFASLILGFIVFTTILHFFYNYPPEQHVYFYIAQETISVVYPTSVEQGETGTITISILNNSTTTIKNLQVKFYSSNDILYYTDQNSNEIEFVAINSGVDRDATISYKVYFSSIHVITTQILVSQENPNQVVSKSFSWQERLFPFPKFLILLIGMLLSLASTFLAKPDWLAITISFITPLWQRITVNK